MASPRDTIWPWIAAAILSLAAALVLMALWPVPAQAASRAQRHWGGSDLFVSCATVREWRPAIARMSAERRRALARQFNVTEKQMRQARDCLRGKKR